MISARGTLTRRTAIHLQVLTNWRSAEMLWELMWAFNVARSQ